MDANTVEAILAYKNFGILPVKFKSTKSNFVAVCKKYEVVSGVLYRDSKPVLLSDDLESIWSELHGNSFYPA